MAFELWETLKESIIIYAGLSPVIFFTVLALGLALYYVVSVMFGSSPQPQHQRYKVSEEEVLNDLHEVPMDTKTIQSTGPSSPLWDVFLSFYGKDTRRNFISNLYYALDQAGIVTFRDDPALEKGEEISLALRTAIKNSKTFVVVLSENYARSPWCLNELVEILRCKGSKNQVIPVFFYVDPSDLRRQKGSFGVALQGHKKRYSVQRIEKWKSALAEIADLSGYHLKKDSNESEADTIRKIVENVAPQACTKILHLEKYLFGIDLAVEEIYQKLSMESNDVRALGICGMGGVGKTTTAKAFYNKYSNKFDISCFMENVKQNSPGGSPLLSLLQQLLIELLRGKDYKVRDVESALRKLEESLCSKKALIVLDDLDQSSYSEFLVRICKLFSDGSRVIITARDANLPNQLKVEMSQVDIHTVKPLENFHSLTLFSRHAFKQRTPPENFIALSESFVTYAGGLPLALKVLGSSLCGRTDVSFWKAKLEKIRDIPVEDIQKILQLSYDELDDETEKAIFLDIVFFFVGKNKDEAVHVFRSCNFFPDTGIPILEERCLLTIDEENRFQMHNLIQDMGRKVIREESKLGTCKRLYLDRENACQALQNLEGRDKIEGLILDLTMSTNKYCSVKIFERLPNLRLLKLIDVHDIKGNPKTSFHELRCISWHSCPWTHLPATFHLQNLVSFEMPCSKFKRLWKDAQLPSLAHMNLDGCKHLKELPESIGQLTKLDHLNLCDCVSLKRLPKFIIQLTALGNLNMSGCSNLKLLPEQLGDMKCLRMLDASNTAIEQLPESIAHLNKLVDLNVRGCINLKVLPEQLGDMKGLQMLDASFTSIEQLSESIAHLDKLVDLKLCGCSNLKVLPEQLGDMKGLQMLDACFTSIEQLPESIAHLNKLVDLKLYGCKKLRKLPEQFGNMEGLSKFDASDSAIEQLPDSFASLPNLDILNLGACSKLTSLPDNIWKLKSLRKLDLGYCINLKRLPEQLGKMQCLEKLDVAGTAIEGLPDTVGLLLPTIKELNLKQCQKLNYVPNSIGNVTSLVDLCLYDNNDMIVTNVPDTVNKMKLQNLRLSCDERLSLPMILCFFPPKTLHRNSHNYDGTRLCPTRPISFSKLSNLRKLQLFNCKSLGTSFPELPLNLEELFVLGQPSLEQLPDLSSFKQLKKLYIYTCCDLKSIQPLPPHLQSLVVLDCASLKDLPDLSMLKDLGRLDVIDNNNLKFSLRDSHLKVGRGILPALRATLNDKEVPEWFSYKSSGSTVYFDIPEILGDNFLGVAFWVVYSIKNTGESDFKIEAVIANKTEDMILKHTIEPPICTLRLRSSVECVRRQTISVKSGDKIKVSFKGPSYVEVKMCGVHVIQKNLYSTPHQY